MAMSLPNCSECGKLLASKSAARKHYQREHSGEVETDPSEFNKFPDTEQRDFAGEEPTTEGHNPEYLTESEREGNNTRLGTLHEFEREKDASLEEYPENDTEDTTEGKE
jgi:hypothetical protein